MKVDWNTHLSVCCNCNWKKSVLYWEDFKVSSRVTHLIVLNDIWSRALDNCISYVATLYNLQFFCFCSFSSFLDAFWKGAKIRFQTKMRNICTRLWQRKHRRTSVMANSLADRKCLKLCKIYKLNILKFKIWTLQSFSTDGATHAIDWCTNLFSSCWIFWKGTVYNLVYNKLL